MSDCYDWDTCDCDCHRFDDGTVMHCMPCCYRCGKCGRNIRAGLHSLHFESCEGTLDPDESFLPIKIDWKGDFSVEDE